MRLVFLEHQTTNLDTLSSQIIVFLRRERIMGVLLANPLIFESNCLMSMLSLIVLLMSVVDINHGLFQDTRYLIPSRNCQEVVIHELLDPGVA